MEKLDTLHARHRLSSWLMTISRRVCIKRFRRWDRDLDSSLVEEAIEDGSTKETLEDSLLRLEKRYLIHRAIERLSPRCQRLLKGLFFDHPPKSYGEVAEELDIPLGGVGPTRARCLEKLHQEFVKLEKQGMSEQLGVYPCHGRIMRPIDSWQVTSADGVGSQHRCNDWYADDYVPGGLGGDNCVVVTLSA